MTTNRIISLKRISNDIREITNFPLEGIGIAPIDNDPMKYLVNIQLMMGIYEGYCLQLLLTFPDNYPTRPPKILIYPGQDFDRRYHHHVFPDYHSTGYKGFCFDLLENNYMETNVEHSGWNPSYTISSILLQVQNFLSNPDLPEYSLPNKDEIQKLMKSMDNYKREFKIKEANGVISIIHTWKNPYPKMHFTYTKMGIDNDEKKIKSEEERKMQIIKENLTCYMLRDNYIDNPDIILGYPIVQNKSTYGKDKIELYPIPQLLTYEAYQTQTNQLSNSSLQSSNILLIGRFFETNSKLKAANNEFFNNWLPIYADQKHFNKNKQTILNSLKAIKNEPEFKPEQIFDILPIILNKMIIGMFNGKSIISSSFIICYFQYVLLFKKLCEEYEDDYKRYVDKKINLITMNDYDANKKIVSDIGNFFMLIFLSNKDMNTDEMKKMKYALFEEFLTRQMYWIFHGPECSDKMKSLIMKNNFNDQNLIDRVYLDKFEDDPDFKMRHLDIFNKGLHSIGIYDQVVNLISNDNDFQYQYYYDKNYSKQMVEQRITQSFKKLFNECSQKTRNELKDIIMEKMHFSEFFEEDEHEIKKGIYDSFKVNLLLKDKNIKNKDEILKYAYESQRGNQLLIITFFALKKIEEKGFMEELEKNYGIYIEVDKFVQDLKQKLKEIKTFKGLYEYIGSEFGKDKDELDLMIEAYERAKEKKYIRDPNEKSKLHNNQYNNYEQYGGRNVGGRKQGKGRYNNYNNSGYGNQFGYNNYGGYNRQNRMRNNYYN